MEFMSKSLGQMNVSDKVTRLMLKKLLKDFKYEFRHTLIVWCPNEKMQPDFVTSLLGERDEKVKIKNHWVSSNRSSKLKVWTGAVAQYSLITFARVTARDLQKYSRFLKVILFKELIYVLLVAELSHPKPNEETTDILLYAQKPLQERQLGELKTTLQKFGKPRKIFLYRRKTRQGVICKVSYTSQFQAYSARTAMNGMMIESFGHVTVEVEVTKSGKKFDEFVKMCLREFTESGEFHLFKGV